MSDTGEILFGKFPPAAPFDDRLRGFDLRILLALCVRCDFKTMVTDHSGVQLAQDFAVNRRAVVRSLKALVESGYLVPMGQSSRHGNRYRVALDNTHPPGTQVSHPAEPPGGTQVSQVPETPVSQSTPTPCDTGVPFPGTQVSHSPEIPRENKRARLGAPDADGADAPGSYWTLLLEASDLEPGTLLVQTARDLGFARINGVDGLQEQYAAFLRHRDRKAYRTPPKRSEFRWWLQRAQAKRASVTGAAENFSSDSAQQAANRPAPTMPAIQVAAVAGTPRAWVDAWRATVGDLSQELGWGLCSSRFGQGVATLRNHDGTAQIVVPASQVSMVRDVFGAKVAAAWAKHMPAVTLQIVAAAPGRGGTARQAAE